MASLRSYWSRFYNWMFPKQQGHENSNISVSDKRSESTCSEEHANSSDSHVIQIPDSARVEDREQKSHSADNTEARKIMEMQTLHQKQVADLLHEIDALKERNLELSQKLSREWDQKISSSEADIENINIKNRPLNLVTDYQMMFSQDWLDMKTELDGNGLGNEEERCRLLCDILMDAENKAKSQFDDVMDKIRKTLALATDKKTIENATGAKDERSMDASVDDTDTGEKYGMSNGEVSAQQENDLSTASTGEMPIEEQSTGQENDLPTSSTGTMPIEKEQSIGQEKELNNKRGGEVENVSVSKSVSDNEEVEIQEISVQIREEWMLDTCSHLKDSPKRASDADTQDTHIAEAEADVSQEVVQQVMILPATIDTFQATAVFTKPQMGSGVDKGSSIHSKDLSSHLSFTNISSLIEQGSDDTKETVIPRHLEQVLNTTMGDILRLNADSVNLAEMEKMVCKSMVDKLNKLTHTDSTLPCDPSALVKYVQACCRLCWKMVLQRPPMLLETPDIGDPFNEETQDLFYAAEDPTKTGVVVCYYIQPTLTHSGKVLVKGKVMTSKKAPEEQLQTHTLEELSSTKM